MARKGLFVPKLHDKIVRRLYHHAQRFSMPVSKLLNLIVAVGLEELSRCMTLRSGRRMRRYIWRRNRDLTWDCDGRPTV